MKNLIATLIFLALLAQPAPAISPTTAEPTQTTNPAAVEEFRQGKLLMGIGENETAITHYQKAIALEPNIGAFYEARGYALLALHHYAEARDDLTKAISEGIKGSLIYERRSDCYLKLGQRSKGMADLSLAIDLKTVPKVKAVLLAKRAHTEIESGQYKQALQDLNDTIRLFPDSPRISEYCLWRADVYDKLGMHEAAQKDRKQAERLDKS